MMIAEKEEIDWEGSKRRIEGAVGAGKMTREEADKYYEGFKKRIEMRKHEDRDK